MNIRILTTVLALAFGSSGISAAQPAQSADGVEATTFAGERTAPSEYNGDLRFLPSIPSGTAPVERIYRPLLKGPEYRKTLALPPFPAPVGPVAGPSAPMPATMQNFAGMSKNDACTGGVCGAGWPPDTNGDVGPNHYIQAVNSSYAIYNKTGTKLASFTENQLWTAAGLPPCTANSQGDPIVLYDALADRWILTHFAFAVSVGVPVSPFYQCIAVSKTSDPVAGGWWFYALRMDPGGAGKPPVGALNDYGKFGIWNDCLYMSANEFQFPAANFIGTTFASFSRADMYAGAPLTWSLGFINNATGPFTMIPSNATGKAASAIPPGTPNYFVSESTTVFEFEVRKFTAGANCGAGGTLGLPVKVSQVSYNFNLPPVDQPNTTNKLDNLGDRLMQKVQYRKLGAKESLWVVHTTQTPAGILAPQWAQLDVTGGIVATTPLQQQIYSPNATLDRWMGSLAVDGQGNMAVGYSTSGVNAPNFPSIAYSGRLAGDPPSTLPQTETQMIAGAGSQTNNCGGGPCDRWGDYSAMSVDPVDDCTFWYTNEYYSSQANGTIGNWQTRIGSFRFPSCTIAPPSTTLVASSANPSLFGQSVTFTASVTGVAPTGNVAFADGLVTIAGCAAVPLTGSGNTRTAACATSILTSGGHTINASYAGDGGNGASSGSVLQTVTPTGPGTAIIVTNPYGPVSVTGATLVGNTISNFSNNTVIQFGTTPGTPGTAAQINFQGLDVGPGRVLAIRSGAPGQFVYVINSGANASTISGLFEGRGGNGALPPGIYFNNPHGMTINPSGSIVALAGLGIDTLGATWTVGQPLINNGMVDGGSTLELAAAKINGGGQFKGNAVVVRTFGNANNPVNGAYFLQNGLQLAPSTGGSLALTLNGYGSAPQVLNFSIAGNAAVWMPSAWPPGSTVPTNNAVVPPGGTRAAGVPDPGYGGGSMIVQATGSLALVNGGTNDFVFPGGIALKSAGPLDINGVVVNQGWTTSGQSFQGVFFESPSIFSGNGNIQVYSNDLNWTNFSTFPGTPVRSFTLKRNLNGSASYAAADAAAPHLNTYSTLSNTSAAGGCWTCLVNTQPVDMFGGP